MANIEDGGFLKPHIFTLTIPQVDGGTNLSVQFSWSQKLLYSNGQLTLKIPFNFPKYVTPAGKKISKREKIQLNVNAAPGTEVLSKTCSHPLKELQRQAGKLAFSYESEVLTWSSSDFFFTYTIFSSYTVGSVLLNSPSLLDVDQRDMFCCYLFPGDQLNGKIFRKELVFVVDISGSMRGKPIDDTKNALVAALSKLDPEDLFGVIAFNDETYLFSSSLTPATVEAIENVTQWINLNFIAGGGTNILLPLNQAIGMLSNSSNSIPIIFLITDGSVEDERHICDSMKSRLTNQSKVYPRIYTLGIGSFCNHYFLRMLAIIGRGYHDVAIDADSIEAQIGRLFATATSIFLANITFEGLDNLDDFEVFPSRIPDLSFESPLIISGRYRGSFPETLKVKGILGDISNFSLDLRVQVAKDIPIDKILAKQQIELLTAQAWYSENKELEEKIAKMSVRNSVVSEYAHMILLETERVRKGSESTSAQQFSGKADSHRTEDSKPQKIIRVYKLGIGFGNLNATVENSRPGYEEKGPPDAGEIFVKAASNCCGKLFGRCCCMCCIQCCSRMNDQCSIALTQLCGALACLGCAACCDGRD
ncbi:inter alpha-trypsin inhibitor, heavy chain 4-like isoform X1 [Olea europaea subsp. europaea]|nr:inter alpha-trypsin inhibitor, heavy chain 4-like isoform X1 [Olea europaea subsp. europaea]